MMAIHQISTKRYFLCNFLSVIYQWELLTLNVSIKTAFVMLPASHLYLLKLLSTVSVDTTCVNQIRLSDLGLHCLLEILPNNFSN